MTLREQIEALPVSPGVFAVWVNRQAVLDIIDQHGPPPGTRLMLVAEELLSQIAPRDERGYRITAEWGEPDEHGWYSPIFTVHYDQPLIPDRDALARALRSLDATRVTSFWDYYLADLSTDDEDWQAVFAGIIIAALEADDAKD